MARAKLSVGIDSLSGKLAKKSGMQMRFKMYKDDTGYVIGVGARWNAQFNGGCDAFLNEGRKEKVVYGMFPVFVRMVLLKEKKAALQSGE